MSKDKKLIDEPLHCAECNTLIDYEEHTLFDGLCETCYESKFPDLISDMEE